MVGIQLMMKWNSLSYDKGSFNGLIVVRGPTHFIIIPDAREVESKKAYYSGTSGGSQIFH